MASTVDHTPGWGGETGISAREGTRARGAHEKFETPGVEMLSGMQERTILIRKSAREPAARRGSAWPGLVRLGAAAASNTRERSPREFQHAARCAERRRRASDAAKEAAAVIASRVRSALLPFRLARYVARLPFTASCWLTLRLN